MNFVKGKFNKIIYQNETNGYVVSLFRVHESDLKELENTTIRVTGIILNLNFNLNFKLTGNYELNSKYNTEQFNVVEYSLVKLTSKEKIIEFLNSPIIKGCGIKTAEILYDTYKEKTLEKLKDLENILSIPSISQKRAQTIHESIVEFSGYETFINKAKDYGLNMEDINKIISKYKNRSLEILTNDVFKLKELLQFKTVDNIFLLNNQKEDPIRIYHLLLEIMNIISNNEGHTYYKLEDILLYLTKYFNLVLEDEALENILNKLKKE